MDFKGLRELIDDIVSLRMRVYVLEKENHDLVTVNSELTTQLTQVSNELIEEKNKLEKLYVESFNEITEHGVNIAEMIHIAEESTDNVIVNNEITEVEEKQIVIDDPVQKRKEYMRVYMKEKRQKAKE